MLPLLALLSFGWPREQTRWIPAGQVPAGLKVMRLNKCCGSMRPAIHGGELAFVEPYRGQPLVGFIVITDKLAHRVVAENGRAVYTSGDANRFSDGWTPKSKVKWVIIYIVRS